MLIDDTDEDHAVYILLVLGNDAKGNAVPLRSICFDRFDLSIIRQMVYAPNSNILSDTRYSDWTNYSGVMFPKSIQINRPIDGYGVTLDVVEMKMNVPVTDKQFELANPRARRSRLSGRRAGTAPPQRPQKAQNDRYYCSFQCQPPAGPDAAQYAADRDRGHLDPHPGGGQPRHHRRQRPARPGRRCRCHGARSRDVGYGFSGSAIPQGVPAVLAKLPHVALATGIINPEPSLFEGVTGVDPVAFQAMSGPFIFDSGHIFEKDNDVIIDTYQAQQLKKMSGIKSPSSIRSGISPASSSQVNWPTPSPAWTCCKALRKHGEDQRSVPESRRSQSYR